MAILLTNLTALRYPPLVLAAGGVSVRFSDATDITAANTLKSAYTSRGYRFYATMAYCWKALLTTPGDGSDIRAAGS